MQAGGLSVLHSTHDSCAAVLEGAELWAVLVPRLNIEAKDAAKSCSCPRPGSEATCSARKAASLDPAVAIWPREAGDNCVTVVEGRAKGAHGHGRTRRRRGREAAGGEGEAAGGEGEAAGERGHVSTASSTDAA